MTIETKIKVQGPAGIVELPAVIKRESWGISFQATGKKTAGVNAIDMLWGPFKVLPCEGVELYKKIEAEHRQGRAIDRENEEMWYNG